MPLKSEDVKTATDRRSRLVNAALEILTSDQVKTSDLLHFKLMTVYFPHVREHLDRMVAADEHRPDVVQETYCAAIVELLERLIS